MLISNAYWPSTGSGIYAGRNGALDVFFSATSATKILIADVPIDLPSITTQNDIEKSVFAKNAAPSEFGVDKTVKERYNSGISQEDMNLFTINFLDFSYHLSHNGTVCNGDFCCNYDIVVVDNGSLDGKVKNGTRTQSYTLPVKSFNTVAIFDTKCYISGVISTNF